MDYTPPLIEAFYFGVWLSVGLLTCAGILIPVCFILYNIGVFFKEFFTDLPEDIKEDLKEEKK